MKGQYRIVLEVMLFAIGVAMASFVLVSFQDLQETISANAMTDQLNAVLIDVMNGAVTASLNENALVRVAIPPTINGEAYRIVAENDVLTASLLEHPDVAVSREIFNIEEGNRVRGDIVSGARIVAITYDGTTMTLQRG